MNLWWVTTRGDDAARQLANRHYSRQHAESKGFVQPGRSLVLITEDKQAVWVTMWPFAQYVRHAWAGAMSCSLFRNEGPLLSSDLIREAVQRTIEHWHTSPKWSCDPWPEMGIVTFVDASKTRKKRDPGRCYLKAGWTYARNDDGTKAKTKSGLFVLEYHPKPEELAMPWTPIEIDDSVMNIEGGQAVLRKAGDYLLTFQEIKPCTEEWAEKNCPAKKPYWTARFTISKGPEGVGAGYTEMFSFSEGAMFRLGQLYARAVNGDPAKLKGRKFPEWKHFNAFAATMTTALKDSKVGALVTQRPYNDKINNQVAEFYPSADYEKRTEFLAPAQSVAASNGVEASKELDDLLNGDTEL